MMTGVRAYNGFLSTTVAVDYLYGLGGVIIGTMHLFYGFQLIYLVVSNYKCIFAALKMLFKAVEHKFKADEHKFKAVEYKFTVRKHKKYFK